MSKLTNPTKEEQKKLAVEVMKTLKIYKPIIKAFEEDDEIMLTEPPMYASYNLNEEQMKIVKRLEEEHGFLIFHATHAHYEFGECLTFLIISKYAEDNRHIIEDAQHGLVFCWVENLDDEWCSEFGTCQFKLMPSGDLKRIS